MADDTRPRLLIIGSGWVGLYMAQYLDHKKYAVTVLSPRRTSAYTPLLASAACGIFAFSLAEEPLRTMSRKPHAKYMKANAASVDYEEKILHCKAGFDDDEAIVGGRTFEMAYDILVIAPGCEPNTFGTPGVAEHAIFVKHVSDAMALRKKLLDQLEKASLPCVTREEAQTLLHVAIVGGGPTGVEITAELYDLAKRELCVLYPDVAGLMSITIFDVADHILGNYDKRLYEYATQKMSDRGVEIQTSSIIEKVEDTALWVKGKGEIKYGILLWVAGNKSVPFVEQLAAKKAKKGLVRVLTDKRLRVLADDEATTGRDSIFALGDAADIDGQSLPTTAEIAVQKAQYLVHNLNKYSVTDSSDWKPFEVKKKGLVTYIGGHDGIAEGYTTEDAWSGSRAWLTWRSGSFTWTRTWRNWIGLCLTMIMNFLFGRDVMRL
jgi:NADH:ubiquinone reductase (non-electrogenic)